ncbi:DUF3560 domain-containing protein [Streptomyces albogriseolus]|uniref:DUF3560 domain-containing protein n=1 Tax=Streptomyces albogriseolus TaxID=1887 RepID=UPI003F49B94B
MVERDGDVWTLVIATPQDSRAERYVWRAGKWSTSNPRGYRAALNFYRAEADGAPRATVADAAPVAPVDTPECGECADGSCVDCVAEAADRKGAEEFRVKATKAHTRMYDGLKRVKAAYKRGNAAQERAEAAAERARAAAATEDERLSARVAYADALVWSLPHGSAERRAAFGEWLSARWDVSEGPAAEACAEADEYLSRVQASASEGWADDDRAGWEDALERAEYAYKEMMIEYGTFEREDSRGMIVLPSLFDAETAWEIIRGHSRDLTALVRHAEAAADAAEADAQQAEEWADAAEAAEGDDTADALTLFTLGAPDARQEDLARAHYGVSDRVAEEWAADVAPVAPVAPQDEPTAEAAPVAPQRAEAAEIRTAVLPGVGVVSVGYTRDAVDGVSVPVLTSKGDDVQVWFAGYVDRCWSHCAPECEGECDGCATLRPVMLCDGEGQPYTWQDCPDCMAESLGVSAGVIARAFTAVRGKVSHGFAAYAMAREEFERADRAANVAEGRAERAGWGEAPREWEADWDRTEYGHVRGAEELAEWAEGLRAEAGRCSAELAACMGAARMVQESYAVGLSVPVATVEDAPQGGAEEPPASQELDANTSKGDAVPGGEGGFSRELDAYASKEGAPEGEGAAAAEAAPVAAGPRVVRRADKIREAEAAADAAEAAAGVLAELSAEAARVADCAPLDDVRAMVAAEAADARWYRMDRQAWNARYVADRLRAEDEQARADVERARTAAARLLSGEVPAGRGAWLSADGGAVVTFPLSWESDDNPAAEKDGAFVAVLADAVAARDEGRTLKATDVPSKVKTGRGPGAEFRAAVATSGRPLVDPWKAPRIPAEGKPLGAETLSAWDMAGDVISETEAAPGVWLPMAAVQLAETACGNGWTVAMQREDGGRTVTVRAAGTAERRGEPVAYELSAVWVDGAWSEGRSGVWVNGERYRGGAPLWRPKERGRQAPSILGTLAHAAEAGTLAPAVPPAGAVSAPAPAGVSDPGTAEAWEGDGGAVPGVAVPRPTAQLRELDANTSKSDTGPGGEGGFSRELDAHASKEAAEVRQARRRAEEAERRAVDARERAERLQGAASAAYGRFAGGQPILMGHHSAAGALRDRARGDAATRKAMAAAEEAERAEVAARGARQAAELAETFAGRSRPWERADFRAGDVVEVRKSYTATYVVVRANAKTLTLRNAHTIDDTKARYDQVISRTRDGQTVTDPGAASTEEGDAPGGEGGISPELDAHASDKPGRCPACGCREVRGGRCDGCGWTPAPAATVDEEEHQAAEEEAAPLAAVAGHPAVAECQATAELLTAYAEEHPGDEEAEGWAFEAVERADFCTWAVEDGDEEGARALADEAKGVRAAFTLGRLDEAGPMTPERLAALDADTLALLKWYAGPWPVRWLWPPETNEAGKPLRPRVINLFHGPGGWSVGIRDVLGADVDMVGVDLDPGAVATAEAAGFEMIRASVTDLDPESPALQWVTGVILSPPCQAYSPAGLRMGRYASAIELIVSVVRCVGAAAGFLALVDEDGNDAGTAPRTGETWDEVRAPLAALDDVRAGLMAEVVVWPLAMLTRGGSVEWVAVEQSSALPSEIERALLDEFVQAGWGTVEAETLDAVDYGAASHRRRRFMTAYRTAAPFVSVRPSAPLPRTTFAECVGWERGRTVATRGKRGINPETGRAKGGGNFSADKPSTCITATAYGWADAETGEKIEQAQIGRLVGFRGDYPWRHVGRGEGIRNRAQQAADAVCPMVAAAVIGRALDVEEWETRARAYAHELYGTGTPAAVPVAPAAGVSVPRPRRAPVAEPVRAMLGAAPTTATAAGTATGAGTGARRNRPRPAGAAAPVRGPLSRGPQGGREAGVSAGHSTRQGAARQGTRQGARQGPGWPLHGSRERGPPPPLGRWAGAGTFPET